MVGVNVNANENEDWGQLQSESVLLRMPSKESLWALVTNIHSMMLILMLMFDVDGFDVDV